MPSSTKVSGVGTNVWEVVSTFQQSDWFPPSVTGCVLFLVGFGLLEDNWETSLD